MIHCISFFFCQDLGTFFPKLLRRSIRSVGEAVQAHLTILPNVSLGEVEAGKHSFRFGEFSKKRFAFCMWMWCDDFFSEQFLQNPVCSESACLCLSLFSGTPLRHPCRPLWCAWPSCCPSPLAVAGAFWCHMKLFTPRCFLESKRSRAMWCTNAEKIMKYSRVPRFRAYLEDPTNWYSCLLVDASGRHATCNSWMHKPSQPGLGFAYSDLVLSSDF